MMKPEYESSWDSFFANIDDKIGSIRSDLGLINIAPFTAYNKVICLEIKLNIPREDGLSSSEESDILFKIEEAITRILENKLEAVFAGAETTDSKRRFYFYCHDITLYDKFISDEMIKFPSYEFEFSDWEDIKWDTYLKFLYPSDEDLQRMGNRNVIENLEERGDDLKTPREVIHWIYFKLKENRTKFITKISSDGFTIEELEKHSEDSNFGLLISRIEDVDLDNIDEVVLKLFRLAKECNGGYDGWETQIIMSNAE